MNVRELLEKRANLDIEMKNFLETTGTLLKISEVRRRVCPRAYHKYDVKIYVKVV